MFSKRRFLNSMITEGPQNIRTADALRQLLMSALADALPDTGTCLFLGFPGHPLEDAVSQAQPGLQRVSRMTDAMLAANAPMRAALLAACRDSPLIGLHPGEITAAQPVPLSLGTVSGARQKRRVVSLTETLQQMRNPALLCVDAAPGQLVLVKSGLPALREAGTIAWIEIGADDRGRRVGGFVKAAKGFDVFCIAPDGRVSRADDAAVQNVRSLVLVPQRVWDTPGLQRAATASSAPGAFDALGYPAIAPRRSGGGNILAALHRFPMVHHFENKRFLPAVTRVLGADCRIEILPDGLPSYVLKGRQRSYLWFRAPAPGIFSLGVVFFRLPGVAIDLRIGSLPIANRLDKTHHQLRLSMPLTVCDPTDPVVIGLCHASGGHAQSSTIKGVELNYSNRFIPQSHLTSGFHAPASAPGAAEPGYQGSP
jgi:hypothetical protein